MWSNIPPGTSLSAVPIFRLNVTVRSLRQLNEQQQTKISRKGSANYAPLFALRFVHPVNLK
jgi:hypothetical protein